MLCGARRALQMYYYCVIPCYLDPTALLIIIILVISICHQFLFNQNLKKTMRKKTVQTDYSTKLDVACRSIQNCLNDS